MAELNVANFWTMYIMPSGFSQDFPCQRFNPNSALPGVNVMTLHVPEAPGSLHPQTTKNYVHLCPPQSSIKPLSKCIMGSGEGGELRIMNTSLENGASGDIDQPMTYTYFFVMNNYHSTAHSYIAKDQL